MLTTIDVVIILVSMAFVVGVGIVAGRKKGDTAHGYFLGGNKMPWWLIGTAFVATGISSEQMIGTVGITYDYGMGIANWEWFGLPAYTLVLLFFIPIYLRNKVTTVPGFLADRFGPAVGTAYSCLLLFLYVFVYMSMVLYAGSLAFSHAVFGQNPALWQTILILLLIAVGVGAYTIHGGLTSVMWADLFQCILLMAGGITLFLRCAAQDSRRLERDGRSDQSGGSAGTHAPLPIPRPPNGAVPRNDHRRLRRVHVLSGGQSGDDPAHAGRAHDVGRLDGLDPRAGAQLLPPAGDLLPRPGRLALDQRDAPVAGHAARPGEEQGPRLHLRA